MTSRSSDEVIATLSDELASHVTCETHSSALEIKTSVHQHVTEAMGELRALRTGLAAELAPLGLRGAAAGLHPLAVWDDARVSVGERYQRVYRTMRELARREPTFALHVHVGIPDSATAITVMNRLRARLPLLLALSANSPYWQGRDSGLASTRTPLFQAFPRVGIPRRFNDYAHYVEAVELLVRCGAVPDPSFLWWDVRPKPDLGTIEIRIMDAQTRMEDSTALAALVQSLVRAEAAAPPRSLAPGDNAEVLVENRFLAARDGIDAQLIDTTAETRRPARELLEETTEFCSEAARELGCEVELASTATLSDAAGAERQRAWVAGTDDLTGLVGVLAEDF